MTHFIVYVLAHNETEVARLLAPYDENKEVATKIEKTRDEVFKYAKEYIKSSIEHFDILFKQSSFLGNKGYVQDLRNLMDNNVDIDSMDDNEAFKLYSRMCPDNEYDEDGNMICHYNPNTKWDWWMFGGRYEDDEYDEKRLCDVDILERNPYVIVTPEDGWVSRGEIGWFATTYDEIDEYVWHDMLVKIINRAKKDKELIIYCVDCHI